MWAWVSLLHVPVEDFANLPPLLVTRAGHLKNVKLSTCILLSR